MLTRFADIRPSERRNVIGGFLTLLGAMVSHSILETARDALFLASLPAAKLPWVYLGIAAAAFVLGRWWSSAHNRTATTGDLVRTFLLVAIGTLAFSIVVGSERTWTLYAVYIWSGVVITVVMLRFWTLFGEIFTVTEAKRVFGPMGVGAVLGAIVGSGVAAVLASQIPARHLVPVAAAALFLTALVPWFVIDGPARGESSSTSEPESPGLARDVELLKQHPHARVVGLVLLVSAAALTLVDYLFKASVAAHIPEAELGQFFAIVYTVLNTLSLVAQLALVSWAIRKLGVVRSLGVLAGFLLLGSVGVMLGGGLIAALATKGADGALRYSLHRTGVELLYLPLPSEVRGRLKSFLDVVGQRGGQALGSFIILGITLAGVAAPAVVGAIVAGLAFLWILLVVRIGDSYLGEVRDALSEATITTQIAHPELDLESFESLMAGLNSTDDATVVAALDLLADQGRLRAVPALILYHPSERVVVRALELFAETERADVVPIADRLLDHDSEVVRVQALLTRTAIDPDEQVLRRARESGGEATSTAALVVLVAHGWVDAETGQESLEEKCGDCIERAPAARALTRAISMHPTEAFRGVVIDLLESDDPEMCKDAVRALAGMPGRETARALIPLLAKRRIRPTVRRTLVDMGAVALDVIGEASENLDLPFDVRLHIPRTLSRFENQQATTLLCDRLLVEDDARVRYKILRALGRLRADDDSLEIDDSVIDRGIQRNLRGAWQLVEISQALREGEDQVPDEGDASEVHGLLVRMLDHMRMSAVERIFRLLGIRDTGGDYYRIWQGLSSSERDVRASSREVLELTVDPELREPLTALLDVELAATGIRRDLAGDYLERHIDGLEAALRELLHLDSEPLWALAVYQIGALGFGQLRPELDRAPPEASKLVDTVVDRARERLETNAGSEEPVHSTTREEAAR